MFFVLKIIEPATDAGISWKPISRSKYSLPVALLNCKVWFHSKLIGIILKCILRLSLSHYFNFTDVGTVVWVVQNSQPQRRTHSHSSWQYGAQWFPPLLLLKKYKADKRFAADASWCKLSSPLGCRHLTFMSSTPGCKPWWQVGQMFGCNLWLRWGMVCINCYLCAMYTQQSKLSYCYKSVTCLDLSNTESYRDFF
jgi:hypothetical protein